jgi:hypothetical protein
MSRVNSGQPPAHSLPRQGVGRTQAADDSASVAEEIGLAVLELAKRAQGAGLSAVGYLLESVALEAGAEAAARRWPTDASEGAVASVPFRNGSAAGGLAAAPRRARLTTPRPRSPRSGTPRARGGR